MLKNLKNNKYFQIGLTAFLVIAASLLTGFVLFNVKSIINILKGLLVLLTPFIIGFVFAYLLNPIVEFFKKNLISKWVKDNNKKKITNLSILITCVLFIAVLVLLFSIIIPELLKSIEKLAVNLPHYIEEIKNYLLNRLSNSELKTMVLNNYANINDNLNKVVNTTLVPKIDEWLVALSNGVIVALKTFFDILLGFVIAIYFLADKENFIGGIKRILYTVFSIKTANKIIENARHTNSIFGDFMAGKLLDSLIIGVVTFLFLAIFGYPYALLIGVLVGITNIIPYFGPWFGAIPSVLLILMDNPLKALIFGLFIIVLQQIDGNILGPKLCGSRVGLKSFWVLASILIFGNLFGVVGMLVGVPIFALIYGYLNNHITTNLKEKELPIKTEEYFDVERINSQTKKITNTK